MQLRQLHPSLLSPVPSTDPGILSEAVLRQREETENDRQCQAPAAPGAAPGSQVPGPGTAAALAAACPAGPRAHLPDSRFPPMTTHVWTPDLWSQPLRGLEPLFLRLPGLDFGDD